MVNILSVLFLIGALFSYYLQAENKLSKTKGLFYTLFALGLILISNEHLNGDNQHTLLFITTGTIGISFILAELTKQRTNMLFALIPALLSSLFLFLPLPALLTFQTVDYNNTHYLFVFALLGSLTPILIHLAKLGIGNLVLRFGNVEWKEEQENHLEASVAFAFIAGISLLSNLFLGAIGLLVTTVFYTSTVLISRNKLGLNSLISFAAAGTLILINFLFYFVYLGKFETLNLLRGEVLEGMFLAGFILSLHRLFTAFEAKSTGKWRILFLVKNISVPVLVSVLILFMFTVKENLGGILSLTGLVAGLALLNTIFGLYSNRISLPVHLLVIGIGLSLAPRFIPIVIESKSDTSFIQKDPNVALEEQPGESLETVKGKWEINPDKSTLKFELGPKTSRTQGQFTAFSGYINVPTAIERTAFYVKIPVKALTTFMDIRDKHLLEEDYFDAEKFATIKFESENVTEKGDEYEAPGTFTMMGVEKEISLTFKVLGTAKKENTEIMIIKGSASLDRTEFGMTPDESIGNVVDVDFEVQFEK